MMITSGFSRTASANALWPSDAVSPVNPSARRYTPTRRVRRGSRRRSGGLDLAARLESDEEMKTSVTTGDGSTRVPSTQRDESAKALNLLIHDLRAPLSVAQGYLRLLQQNRLEAEADRQRAMTQSMEALGRITRLCEEAAEFVAEPASTVWPI